MSTSHRAGVATAIARDRLIPIVRMPDRLAAAARIEGIASAGAAVIELTMTTPSAVDLVEQYASCVPALGLGSVCTVAEAEAALDAGATFLVTPGLVAAVIEYAHERDAFAVAGALTPTEIMTAWSLGADAVKLFPASVGGVSMLRDIRAPLPHIPLIPTGGVDRTNAEQYLAAGAVAVGVGSALSAAGEDVTDSTRHWLRLCRPPTPMSSARTR